MHVLLPLERLGVVLQRMIRLHMTPATTQCKMDYYVTNWVPRTTKRSYGRRQELIGSYHTYGEDELVSKGFGTVHRTNIKEEATSLKL